MKNKLQLHEDISADYLYIDSENKIHLLVPIVGGDSIGLDNTCKTAMELQTFFHGREGTKSALAVLKDYKKNLDADIELLNKISAPYPIIHRKKERLDQIQTYIDMFSEVQALFVDKNASFPTLSDAIHSLMAKQSNCFSIWLSPKKHDFVLRTQKPLFSLNRQIPKYETIHGNRFIADQTPDNFSGFGPSLRRCIEQTLQMQTTETPSISIKEEIIAAVVSHFNQKPQPTLLELQEYTQVVLQQNFSTDVDLKTSQYPLSNGSISINEDYLNDMGMTYTGDIEDCLTNVLGLALNDDFWNTLKKSKLIKLGESSDPDRVDKVSIVIQFFIAHINLYCKATGKANVNFGLMFEKKRDEISKLIAASLLCENVNVEDVLFDMINASHRDFGLTNKLTTDDINQIKAEFSNNYQMIKESPHFDEFIFFREEIPGDFFNHKNRISISFIDLIRHSSHPFISTKVREAADNLQQDLLALKTHPERKLNPKNSAVIQAEHEQITMLIKKLVTSCENPKKSATLTPEIWNQSVTKLNETIQEYKKRGKFFLKSSKRKTQVLKLENICANFNNHQLEIQTLIQTITNLNDLYQTIKEEAPNSTLAIKIVEIKNYLIKAFTLENSPIELNPQDPIKYLLAWEKQHLDTERYPALRLLDVKWWSKEGIEIIKRLPNCWENYDTICFLNTKNPNEFDDFVIESIHTDANLNNIPKEKLPQRINYLMQINALDCGIDIKKILLQLQAPWWNNFELLESLISYGSKCTPQMIAYLNMINPKLLDEQKLKGIIVQLAKNQHIHQINYSELQELGRRYELLGPSHQDNIILYDLDIKWWSKNYIDSIKSLNSDCHNEHLIKFLNKIDPSALTEKIKLELTTVWDKKTPIYLNDRHVKKLVSTELEFSSHQPKNKSILLIDKAKQEYATHCKNKWFRWFGFTNQKNDVISSELQVLINKDQNIEELIKAVIATKIFLEKKYPNWFFNCFIPKSTRILEKLIESLKQISQEEQASKNIRLRDSNS